MEIFNYEKKEFNIIPSNKQILEITNKSHLEERIIKEGSILTNENSDIAFYSNQVIFNLNKNNIENILHHSPYDSGKQWKPKTINMMYLITKQINNNVVDLLRQPIPRFLAVSITGLGGTIIEPNVPKYEETFDRLEKLIDSGFDVNDLVIRIDPLYPGINTPDVNKKLLVDIIERTYKLGVKQIYTSIFDIYKNTPQSMLDELDMSVYDNGFAVDNVLHANKHYLKEMFSVVDELIYKVSNGSIKHSLCGEHGDVIPKYAIKLSQH